MKNTKIFSESKSVCLKSYFANLSCPICYSRRIMKIDSDFSFHRRFCQDCSSELDFRDLLNDESVRDKKISIIIDEA